MTIDYTLDFYEDTPRLLTIHRNTEWQDSELRMLESEYKLEL